MTDPNSHVCPPDSLFYVAAQRARDPPAYSLVLTTRRFLTLAGWTLLAGSAGARVTWLTRFFIPVTSMGTAARIQVSVSSSVVERHRDLLVIKMAPAAISASAGMAFMGLIGPALNRVARVRDVLTETVRRITAHADDGQESGGQEHEYEPRNQYNLMSFHGVILNPKSL